MRLTFTRRQVIKALRTEPLVMGIYTERRDLNKVGKCRVCAIGAVLRSQRLTNVQINSVGTGPLLGPGGRLLRKLEQTFEYAPEYDEDTHKATGFYTRAGNPTKKMRAMLVAFVKKTFPASFTVNIPQANLEVITDEDA